MESPIFPFFKYLRKVKTHYRFSQYLQEVKTYYRFNFKMHLIDGMLAIGGMSLIEVGLLFPAFVRAVNGPNLYIGLFPAIFGIGFMLPSILIANYTETLFNKKNFAIFWGIFQRLPVLLMGVVVIFFYKHSLLVLNLLCLFLGITAISIGTVSSAWYELFAKTIPTDKRGLLASARESGGYLLCFLGGIVIHKIFKTILFPYNYACIFSLAFTIYSLSLLFFSKIKEPYLPPKENKESFNKYFKKLLNIFKEDTNFKKYLISYLFSLVSLFIGAFYTAYALKKFNLEDAIIGKFLIIGLLGKIVGTLIAGKIGDVIGYKINLIISICFIILSSIFALFSPFLKIYYCVFVIYSLSQAFFALSSGNITLELARTEDRIAYTAIRTFLASLLFFILPFLYGKILDYFNYSMIFILSIIFAILSLCISFLVQEPRKKKVLNEKELEII